MSVTYPPGPAAVGNDFTTISRFLNDPTAIGLRVNWLARQKWVTSRLLTGTAQAEGGAIVFSEDSPLDTTDDFVEIAPGSEFPLTNVATGPRKTMTVAKFGREVKITVESVKRQKFDPVNRAMNALVNRGMKSIEAAGMTAIQAAVTATSAATTTWDNASAKILLDIAKAKAAFATTDYTPDTLLVSSDLLPYVITHEQVLSAQPRESRDNTLYTGDTSYLMGVDILSTDQLAAPGAWMFDSQALGGIAVEDLPVPDEQGYETQFSGVPINITTRFDIAKQSWFVQAYRSSVAYVQAPTAGIRITGVTA